jgi:threonine dehydratase
MTLSTAAADAASVSIDDIRDAVRVLDGVAVRTPLLPLPEIAGSLRVKPEMLQRGGAFKFRGAYYFISRLSEAERARGVVAPSSGNHAQAVALAARLFGIDAVVVMPTTVTPAKRAGAERLGARIELAGTTTADRMSRAEELVRDEGLTMVPPYDDSRIIAGQGTIGIEILEQAEDVRTVIVPVGGGGLSAGVALAIKSLNPSVRIVAVEPEGAPKLSRAMDAGRPVRLEGSDSIADGLLAVEIGGANFAVLSRHADEVVTIPDSELRPAMRFLLDRAKLVSEPSGAITLAAVMSGRVPAADPTVAVLSGGNVEWPGLTALLGNG